MSPATIAALGVFLTGLGSFISAFAAMRVQRKRSEDDCARRIAEFRNALREGMTMQFRDEDERWSHLP